MNPLWTASISAIICTYFLSRAILRIVPRRGTTWLLAAHLASLAILVLFVGFVKSYFVTFALDQTLVLFPAQILWLILDGMRGKGTRRA